MAWAWVILCFPAFYLSAGILFAVAFATVGIGQIDHAAIGAPLFFRLLIIPGAVLLWPVLSVKWIRTRRGAS